MGIEEARWFYARNWYTCDGCGETIPKGMRHQSFVVRSATAMKRVRLCERCAYAATNKIMANNLDKLDITPGMFAWDKLNNKFRNWWRELMETRQHELEHLEKIKGRL